MDRDPVSTNTSDKDERKKLRRKRIVRKQNNSLVNDDDFDNNKTAAVVASGAVQVKESLYHLDERKNKGLKDITYIRVKTDDREATRRITDDDMRRERLGKLQQEALVSAKANAAIDMKWAGLLELDMPQEIHENIQSQMSTCTAVIRSKDEIIADFQRQLRAKDEEYVRTLRAEAEDIEVLINRIQHEFTELQSEYNKELSAIESAYANERERMISENTADIEAMLEIRKLKETNYKESRQKREELYQREIEDLISKGAAQYNKLKIELEMNIQTLKQQLEEIRATYQLNTEKLDYNYRVLTELDVEKNAELSRYKRRLAKLKDQLNQLVTKYSELETQDSKMNNELTGDYRSLTKKYKDLQSKFRHFEVADTSKYDEMWTMHEDEAKDLVDQLLKADKLISEQLLGWRWKGPDMIALQQVLGRHGSLGVAQGAGAASGGQVMDEDELVVNDQLLSENVSIHAKKVAATRIKGMMQLLATEAGFLINPDVVHSISKLSDDEATVLKAETMLKTLGIKNQDKLNALMSYFFKGDGDGYARQSIGQNEAEQEAELALLYTSDNISDLKSMIQPEDVISAIKSYIEDVTAESGPIGGGAIAGSSKAKEEEERIKLKRLQSMQNYWNQLSQIVNDESVDVWRQFEKNGTRELLSNRASAIGEVDMLSRRNAELKRLLNQYLGDATINGALQVPPAQVMKARNISGSNTVRLYK